MEPILISFGICVIGVIGAVTLFSVAMRDRSEADSTGSQEWTTRGRDPFFLDEGDDGRLRVLHPSDPILVQLESHFRMEEAAAASFLQGPNSEILHAPSQSPLWD